MWCPAILVNFSLAFFILTQMIVCLFFSAG
jgi:hypothetical protein